nr:hypothetical protein [Tanacetum cinerariifolium]
MYKRRNSEGRLCSYYQSKVNEFLNFAFSIERVVERKTFGSDVVFRIKCPCSKCKIKVFKKRDEVKFDLWHNGFIRGYTTWYAHGERKCRQAETGECSKPTEEDNVVGCIQMILDIHNTTFQSDLHPDNQEEQAANSFAKQYYEMLEADDEPLYEGCKKFSTLEAATRLLNWKVECNVPEATYNRALSLFKDMLPDGNQLKGRRNNVPNLVLTYFPIAPRLQRMYMSKKMSKEMTWQHDHKTDSNKKVHPSDGKAWKHFDSTHPTFSKEIRNVRLGLCTDGFNPNNSNSDPYSLWPVFLTIYNLPTWMSLKDKRDEVKFDLWHNGFIRGYTTWYVHGERKCRRAETGECSEPIEEDNVVGCIQMILDIHNTTFQSDLHPDNQEEQAPNTFAKQYYEMLEADDEPLYKGCKKF